MVKEVKMLWRRNYSGVMFHRNLVVFQSCKFKRNVSPKKESVFESIEGEFKDLEESKR